MRKQKILQKEYAEIGKIVVEEHMLRFDPVVDGDDFKIKSCNILYHQNWGNYTVKEKWPRELPEAIKKAITNRWIDMQKVSDNPEEYESN